MSQLVLCWCVVLSFFSFTFLSFLIFSFMFAIHLYQVCVFLSHLFPKFILSCLKCSPLAFHSHSSLLLLFLVLSTPPRGFTWRVCGADVTHLEARVLLRGSSRNYDHRQGRRRRVPVLLSVLLPPHQPRRRGVIRQAGE